MAETITGIIQAAVYCAPAARTEVISICIMSPPTMIFGFSTQSSIILVVSPLKSLGGPQKHLPVMGSCPKAHKIVISPAKAWFDANPNETSTEILKNTIAGTSNFFNAQNHYVNKLFQYIWIS